MIAKASNRSQSSDKVDPSEELKENQNAQKQNEVEDSSAEE